MLISDWSSDVCSSDLLGVIAEDVLGHLVLVAGVADADADAAEFISDMRFGGTKAVMPGGAASDLHLDLHGGQVELVVEDGDVAAVALRSEEHTSELQSLMRISYAVFCLKKKNTS